MSIFHSKAAAGAAIGVLFSAAFIAAPGCGGSDPYCGDGFVDDGEQCDDGNDDQTDYCRSCFTYLPPQTTIKWAFNKNAAPMFDTDGCLDMSAVNVEVELTGPMSVTATEQCSLRQVVFDELPQGVYGVKLTPKDINDMSLVNQPIESSFAVTTGDLAHEVTVPYDAWARSYTGTFFFRVRWAGVDCGAALPPVVQQRITLTQDGVAVGQSTMSGLPLNGSAPGPCVSVTESFPQSAAGINFGPAQIRIEGLDSGGVPQFDSTIETFVGAGISNPEFTFDVNSLAPDAGVDAGAGDAGTLDAGV